MTDAGGQRLLESIEYDLRSEDEEVRRLAVERMSELPGDEALPRISQALGDPSWRVRKAAVARILALEDPTGTDCALIEALADGENSGRRNAAVEALVRRGAAALPPLLEALDSADADVRKQIVDAVAGIGEPSAEAAIRALLGDGDPNVAASAADALGMFGGRDSVPELVRAAVDQETDRLVRVSALRSLARLEAEVDPHTVEPMLEDSLLRPAALVAMASSDHRHVAELLLKNLTLSSRATREASIRGLLQVLGRRDQAEAADLVARVRSLGAAQPELLDRVVEGLESGDLSTRMVQIQFLGLMGDARAAVPILEAGRDEALSELGRQTLASLGEAAEVALDDAGQRLDTDLQLEVCRTFGSTVGPTGAARLERVVEDLDPSLRIAAIDSLGSRGDTSAVAVLVRRLESASLGIEESAQEEVAALVDALVDIASEGATGSAERGDRAGEVVRQLTARLESAADSSRLAVARVLGQIGRPQDECFVARLLKDPSPRVRTAAVAALTRLAGDAKSEPLRLALADDSVRVRCAAATALGQSMEERILEDLIRLGTDQDSRVRAAALRATGRYGSRHPSAYDEALGWIRSAEAEDPAVAIAAAEALAVLGGADAAAAARELLMSPEPEVVQAAVACIALHGDSEGLDALLDLAGHRDWSVRAEVIQTFAHRGFVRAVPVILRRLETEQDGFVRDTILASLARLDG